MSWPNAVVAVVGIASLTALAVVNPGLATTAVAFLVVAWLWSREP